jgi:hypothetical protein
MRRPAREERVQPTKKGKKAATAKKRGTIIRLVPKSLPLVDLGLGADVSIRFPMTGPVVEIMRVSEVPGDWAGCLIAAVLAAKSSR